MTDKTKVVRTSTGLVDALFDSIDKVNSGDISPEHARAVSHTAKTIVNVARLEMEYRKLGDKAEMRSLTIDKAHDRDADKQAA